MKAVFGEILLQFLCNLVERGDLIQKNSLGNKYNDMNTM